MELKKVLFIGQKPYTPAKGGIGSYINHRAFLLSSQGFEVWWSDSEYYCKFDSQNKIWEQCKSILPRPVIKKILSKIFFSFSAEWLNAKQNIKPDIIEIPDGLSAFLPRNRNTKIIIQCHASWILRNFLNNKKNSLIQGLIVKVRSWIQNEVFKKADSILACSHEIALLESGFHKIHPDKIIVLSHYFSQEAEEITFQEINEREDFYLVVGNFEYLKGFDLILSAFNKYRSLGGKYRLVFAGNSGWRDDLFEPEWGDSEVIREFRNSPSERYVDFLGTIDKNELTELRSRATAVIIGSRFESFTMVAGECFLSNTPLILSDRTGWSRLAYQFNAAMIISPYDINSFAEAMLKFEDQSEVARFLPGIEAIRNYLTGADLRESTVRFYQSIYNP